MNIYTNNKLSIDAYILILKLVTPEHIDDNEQIVQILNNLSEDENGYIRNLTKRTLDEKNKTIFK